MGTIIATIIIGKAVNKVEYRMIFYLLFPSAIKRCDLTVHSDLKKHIESNQ